MRFDDSLKTVLSADTTTAFGAGSAWRQLVDLMARGRIASDATAIERLRALRLAVPAAVRAASARALAFGSPGAALVGFFAEDELAIAAPILQTATLEGPDWCALLPALTPVQRSVLRNRRDLPADAVRGLASFGATDFVLSGDVGSGDYAADVGEDAAILVPGSPAADTPRSETPFVALGEVARGLPVVAEALRRAAPPSAPQAPRFEISDLVARIDAFTRNREDDGDTEPAGEHRPPGFRFESDAAGRIRWIDGGPRTVLIGASIATSVPDALVRVDGIATGAFRRRSRFESARMEIGGVSELAGSWRLAGVPVFDRATGRFTGHRGVARRPRADESASPSSARIASESLRQLVHELRTPTNAVAGFAELIESELLGPVAPVHRARAATIRHLAGDLIGAIGDLDAAARMEGGALDLRPTQVAALPILERIVADLRQLADLRGVDLMIEPRACDLHVVADDRTLERLLARLMAAVVSAGGRGERLGVSVDEADGRAAIAIDRPVALADPGRGGLFAIDAETEHEAGSPLLGTGFALRLASNLASALGGALTVEPARLVLTLPQATTQRQPDIASNN